MLVIIEMISSQTWMGHWFLTHLSGIGKTGQLCLINTVHIDSHVVYQTPFRLGQCWKSLCHPHALKLVSHAGSRASCWSHPDGFSQPRFDRFHMCRVEMKPSTFPTGLFWFVLIGFGACEDLGFDDFMKFVNVFTPFILIAATWGCWKNLVNCTCLVLLLSWFARSFTVGAIQPASHFDNAQGFYTNNLRILEEKWTALQTKIDDWPSYVE